MIIPREPVTEDGITRLRQRLESDIPLTPFNTTASLDAIRRFVKGIGDPNPLWTDLSYGEQSHYGTVLAPPSFLMSVVTPTGLLAGGLPGVHSMLVEQRWLWYRPVRLDDRIHPSARLTDVQVGRNRRGKPTVLQTVHVQYRNQWDQLVAEAWGSSLRFRRPGPDDPYLYELDPATQQYSPDQLKAFEDEALQQAPRGKHILYWEDVEPGEEIPAVLKGPLSFGDVEAFMAGTYPVEALHRQAAYARRHPAGTYRDETNYPQPLWHVLFRDELAQQMGFPRAHDAGGQRASWVIQMLTHWMGDDGQLVSLSLRFTRPNFHGDVTWCRGVVEAKERTDQGEALVRCRVWCQNQRGERTAEGEAQVRLLSRSVELWGRALREAEKAQSGAG
jgi:acyl dehydratase